MSTLSFAGNTPRPLPHPSPLLPSKPKPPPSLSLLPHPSCERLSFFPPFFLCMRQGQGGGTTPPPWSIIRYNPEPLRPFFCGEREIARGEKKRGTAISSPRPQPLSLALLPSTAPPPPTHTHPSQDAPQCDPPRRLLNASLGVQYCLLLRKAVISGWQKILSGT